MPTTLEAIKEGLKTPRNTLNKVKMKKIGNTEHTKDLS